MIQPLRPGEPGAVASVCVQSKECRLSKEGQAVEQEGCSRPPVGHRSASANKLQQCTRMLNVGARMRSSSADRFLILLHCGGYGLVGNGKMDRRFFVLGVHQTSRVLVQGSLLAGHLTGSCARRTAFYKLRDAVLVA
jgi:hypothetical protein